jgi:hypothetical protein
MNRTSYVPVFDAMKIYEQKPELRVRLWFVTLLGLYGASRLLPMFDPDFTEFAERAVRFVQGEEFLPVLSDAQIRFIIFYLLILAISAIAGADYLSLYLDGHTAEGSRVDGRKAGRILLFSLMLGGIVVFSSTLLLIPFYLFLFAFYFVPAEIVHGNLPLSRAMQVSYRQTKGKRFPIGINVLFLIALTNIAQSAVFAVAGTSRMSLALVGGFFFAWQSLSRARLIGILYKAMVIADWPTTSILR